MVSCIIMDGGEPNVIQLTFENLYKELKDINGSELLIKKDWFDLSGIKNRYVCFVEPDCLISEGYFKTQLGHLKKKGYSRLTGIMGSATSVNYWNNPIYGYRLSPNNMDGFMPNRDRKSSGVFTVQVAYIPGAIIRVSMLQRILEEIDLEKICSDLVYMSTEMSLAFWRRGYRVDLNPRVQYVTTEDYVNDMGIFQSSLDQNTLSLFGRESI